MGKASVVSVPAEWSTDHSHVNGMKAVRRKDREQWSTGEGREKLGLVGKSLQNRNRRQTPSSASNWSLAAVAEDLQAQGSLETPNED